MSYTFVGSLGAAALSSAAVKTLQAQANAVLGPQGYNAIGVDGFIGPKTCGAIRESAKFDGGALLAQATTAAGGDLSSLCKSFTVPTLKRGSTPTQVINLDAQPNAPVAPTPGAPAAPSAAPSSALNTKTIMIAGGLVAGVIVLVYASKRKPKKAAAA